MNILPQGELQYIIDGINESVRSDGRNHFQFRPLYVELDVLRQCFASCKVRLGSFSGATEVIVGIKGEYLHNIQLKEVSFDVSVDCSPGVELCSHAPGIAGSVGFVNKTAEEIIASYIQQMYNCFFQSTAASVNSFMLHWHIHIDILIIEFDGCILDTCSIATLLGFSLLRFPVIGDENFGLLQSKDYLNSNNSEELSSFASVTPFVDISEFPIYVSVNILRSSLSHVVPPLSFPSVDSTQPPPSVVFFLDSTSIEEGCITSCMSFGVNKNGRLFYSVKREEGSHSCTVTDILKTQKISAEFASEMIKELENYISQIKSQILAVENGEIQDDNSKKSFTIYKYKHDLG
jgi:exosome complex component RRP42